MTASLSHAARPRNRHIKVLPAYTAAYGQQLGIIGADDTCLRREGRSYGR